MSTRSKKWIECALWAAFVIATALFIGTMASGCAETQPATTQAPQSTHDGANSTFASSPASTISLFFVNENEEAEFAQKHAQTPTKQP
jgi:hypothetical protein